LNSPTCPARVKPQDLNHHAQILRLKAEVGLDIAACGETMHLGR
jgi:hypothetical protein